MSNLMGTCWAMLVCLPIGQLVVADEAPQDLTCMPSVPGRTFGSMVELRTFVDLECEIGGLIAFKRRRRLDLMALDLTHALRRYDLLCEDASINDYAILNHPVRFILYLKRLKEAWMNIETILTGCCNDISQMSTDLRVARKLFVLTNDDINANTVSLVRLQSTYNITAKEMLRLSDVKRRTTSSASQIQITARDCLEIAQQATNIGDSIRSFDWLQMALNLLAAEDPKQPTTNLEAILTELFSLFYSIQNYDWAMHYAQQLLAIAQPGHFKGVQGLLVACQTELSKQNRTFQSNKLTEVKHVSSADDTTERLCRGGILPDAMRQSRLRCYYQNTNDFLRLAPLKSEVVHLRPKIVIFRNVVSSNEAEMLRMLSEPALFRARTFGGENHASIETDYRITQITWLPEHSDTVKDVNRRTADMTGLSLRSAEKLQVANYGFGGHYGAHYDYTEPDMVLKHFRHLGEGVWAGNRVATVLLFLSTPDAGGATVFPYLNLAVRPSKHDAIMWFNTLPSGLPDNRTLHSGCPVLSGTKWIANKWFHQRDQEFLRPCALSEDYSS